MTDWSREISLAAEIGGQNVPRRILSSVTRLRIKLSEHCRSRYSSEVLGIALAVRVDGELKQYDFEGVDSIRRNKKNKYIGADIGVPSARWKQLSGDEFDQYLFSSVKAAIEMCVRKLKKDRVDIDERRLYSDLSKVEARFLAARTGTVS